MRLRRLVPLSLRRPIGIAAYRLSRATPGGRTLRRRRERILAHSRALWARSLLYNERYYENAEVEKTALYPALATALVELTNPRSAVDVGCGSGLMLAVLARLGVEVQGVEGSKAAIRRSPVRDRIVRANLEHGVPSLGRFDVCLCIEVAEHLSPEAGPRLVEGLTRLSDTIVFSAATPGQRGLGHINEQPHSYWHELFQRCGFEESSLRGRLLSMTDGVPGPDYIRANLITYNATPREAGGGTSLF